jgi:gamma-glutamyl hercynylcysteine S-oxide synthase
MKKQKKQIEIPEISDVKLKPIFGMQPGLYLTILYALILVLILFLVFVLPGIRNYGSNVHFSTNPAGTAVYVDGQYLGSTPFTRFVPAGEHTVRYEKPYFQEVQQEMRVPGKLFGTLVFKRAEKESADLNFSSSGKYLRWRFDQVSDWSLVGSFYERYRYPFRGVQAVSEYVQAAELGKIENTGDASVIPQDLYDFTYMLVNNINSFEQLIDATAAISALDSRKYRNKSANEYISTNMASDLLQSSVEAFVRVGTTPVLAALYVETAAQRQNILEIADDENYRANREELQEYLKALPFSQVYSSTGIQSVPMSVYDHSFVEIVPPEEIPVGNAEFSADRVELEFSDLSVFPHVEKLEPYYISSGEVTRRQFERFLQDSPDWQLENIDVLITKNKVDENYLNYRQNEPVNMNLPVTDVSWHAAKAYCQWFEAQLPDAMRARYLVRLPLEAEWEFAARKNSAALVIDNDSGFDGPQAGNYSREGRLGLIDMQGNVWEWCENWYFPADVLDGNYGAAVEGYDGRERALRGGSWVNRSREVTVWTRASHPPHWCSPFTGFRIVLEPK